MLSLFLVIATPEILTLDQALALAEQRSPALRQSRAHTAHADAQRQSALAPLLPQVQGSVGYSRGTANNAQSIKLDSFDQLSTGLSLRQLIWDFGRTTGRHDARLADLAAAQADERAARQDLLFAVRAGWLDALGARALVEVAKDAVDNEQRHQEQVAAQIGVGMRAPIDLAQVRTVLAGARADLIAAEQSEMAARLELGRVVGTGGSPAPPPGAEPLGPLEGEDGSLEELLGRAQAARPELEAARQLLLARERDVGAARGEYWPTLSAALAASAGGSALDAIAPNASASVDLNWPLFEGFGTDAAVRASEASAAQARALVEAVQLQLQVDLQQAQQRVRSARARLAALEEADAAAAAELELAEARYKAGTGTIIELGDAQSRRVTASAKRAQAMTDLGVSRAALLRALGE